MKRLVILAALLALPACASAEARDLAAKNRKHLALVRQASAPLPNVDGAVWRAAFDEAERAAANLEEALK